MLGTGTEGNKDDESVSFLCVLGRSSVRPGKNRIPSHLYFFIYDNFLAFYEFELILIRSLTNQHLHHKLLVAYIARLYHCTISHI